MDNLVMYRQDHLFSFEKKVYSHCGVVVILTEISVCFFKVDVFYRKN